jgi:hypothetical protein
MNDGAMPALRGYRWQLQVAWCRQSDVNNARSYVMQGRRGATAPLAYLQRFCVALA